MQQSELSCSIATQAPLSLNYTESAMQNNGIIEEVENLDGQAQNSSIVTASTNEAQEEIDLKCKKCGHKFGSKRALRNHSKAAEQHTCCGNTYCTLSFYNYHQVTEHQMEGVVCNQCKTCYGSKCALRRHIANHNKKQAVCLICDKEFSTEVTLNNHFVSKHLGIYNKCIYCSANFFTRSSLNCHLKKAAHCSVCQQVLCAKQLLNSHNCTGQAQNNYDLKPYENLTDREVDAEELSDQLEEYDDSAEAASLA